jgi:hypothetical protein
MNEVLKQMYQLLLTEPHAPAVCDQLELMLREAIAELESQEPVIFCMHWEDRWGCNHYVDPKEPHPADAKPLYTYPPQRTWVGLEEKDMPDGEDPMFDHKYFILGMVYANNVLLEKNI